MSGIIMSKEPRKSRYRSLTCNVSSTIPRHSSYRDTWIQPSTPPRPSRAISFVENAYCSKEDLSVEDLKAMKGQVERWKKYFSAQPLATPPTEEDTPKPQSDNPVKIITYSPSKPYPKPTPRRTKTLEGKDFICCSLGRQNVGKYLCNINSGNEKSGESKNESEKQYTNRKTPRRYTDFITPTIWQAVQKYENESLQRKVRLDKVNQDSGFDEMQVIRNTIENESLATAPQQYPDFSPENKRVSSSDPVFSCRSDAAVRGGVDAGNKGEVLCENICTLRRSVAGDVGGMCDVGEKKSPMPRVIAASVKSYKDIPEEFFNSLPESSVDPSPDEKKKDCQNELRYMREGRRALLHSEGAFVNKRERFTAMPTSNYESCKSTTNDSTHPYTINDGSVQNNSTSHRYGRDSLGGTKDASISFPPPPPLLVKYSEFPPSCYTPPVRAREHPEGSRNEYLSQLERDLQMAGIYFRKPEIEPPYEGSDAEGDIHKALATLDASLEGFCSDGSSSESSATRSHASSVVERETESQFSDSSGNKSIIGASSKNNFGGAVTNSENRKANHESLNFATKGYIQQRSDIRANVNKTVIHVDGGFRDSDLSAKNSAATQSAKAMENFNLIEEVYITSKTKSAPQSTVQMNAYYPVVSISEGRVPSCTSSVHVNIDSDSGHESGATSPCETLTGEDTVSPPPSPPTPKISQNSLAYENNLRKYSRTHDDKELKLRNSVPYADQNKDPIFQSEQIEAAVVKSTVDDDYINISVASSSKWEPTNFVVVAIDFGTTYSGYAFSFTNYPENIHMMKKWEGGDPGIQNQKTPTIVLLTPEEEFHSLGFTARDTYHDIDPAEAQNWLYFDKFKMELHSNQTLTRDSLIEATNGKKVSALTIFSFALQYFRDHALKELSEQIGVEVEEDDVRWVITVPAIWSHPAKQFMRMAAYKASMGSPSKPDQLLIALEPEAAAIYCRRLRQNQLLQERPPEMRLKRLSGMGLGSQNSTLKSLKNSEFVNTLSSPCLPELDREVSLYIPYSNLGKVSDWLPEGTVYMVVDCGGGTVDITVHQMTDRKSGHLKELHKATGGPYGSIGVDKEFEKLLKTVFGTQFMSLFKAQRSAAYVELMIAFEARKRNASPNKSFPLNISLPFAFIDFYKKTKGKDVESAIKKHNELGIKWSSQGMLRIEQETMKKMFDNTLAKITQAIESVLSSPEVGKIQYMFLVGGFAESELLQKHIRDSFESKVNVIIPQGMGLAILLGAVQFGLDPSVVTVRRSRLTYGVGVLNKFDEGVHPLDKKVVAAGSVWCADILDKFVEVDESVAVGDVVTRSYTPATPSQKSVILHLYATESHDVMYVTDKGVRRVGTLKLDLGNPTPKVPPRKLSAEVSTPQNNTPSTLTNPKKKSRREITVHLKFGGTEVKASAVDHFTGLCVKANIEFIAL